MTSIREILSLAEKLESGIDKLDVKTSFFHEDLDDEVYMEQPKGFVNRKKILCVI